MAKKAAPRTPTDREAVLLQALVAGEKYGLELRDAYEAGSGRRMPFGSLYTTLDRMESKGFVESRIGEASAETGGNRRRYFRLRAEGAKALERYSAALHERAGALAKMARAFGTQGQPA